MTASIDPRPHRLNLDRRCLPSIPSIPAVVPDARSAASRRVKRCLRPLPLFDGNAAAAPRSVGPPLGQVLRVGVSR